MGDRRHVEPGRINVLLGEGQTAQVLRNMCYQVYDRNPNEWKELCDYFVGQPHRINDRGSQVIKSLKDIGFDQYYQAEQTGWVLYLEGSTDLAILTEFAKKLDHPVQEYLSRPFVYYIGNQISKAREHFHGLLEAKPDLVGIAIVDRTDMKMNSQPPLLEVMWGKREIENYLCTEEVLIEYSRHGLTQAFFPDIFRKSICQT